MNRCKLRLLLCVALVSTASQIGFGQIINLDFQVNGDNTYIGAGGAMSSFAGLAWNGVDETTVGLNLDDEFGNSTGLLYSPGPSIDALGSSFGSPNELQNSGFGSLGGGFTFAISGFATGQSVDLLLYMDPDTIIDVLTDTGLVTFDNTGGPYTGNLPGVAGGDYVQINGLMPLQGPNEFIFGVTGHDGLVTGVQMRVNAVPEPAAAGLATLLVSCFAMRRRRKN